MKNLLKVFNFFPLLLIKIYQKFISPLTKPNCRYYPTCSEYAKISFKKYNFFKASYKSTKRILKCNPFFEGGIDEP